MARARRATVLVHAIAASLPEVERDPPDPSSPSPAAYQVGGKTFVLFRGPRKREVITDAWLVRAPKRLARSFLGAADEADTPGASG